MGDSESLDVQGDARPCIQGTRQEQMEEVSFSWRRPAGASRHIHHPQGVEQGLGEERGSGCLSPKASCLAVLCLWAQQSPYPLASSDVVLGFVSSWLPLGVRAC